RPRQASHVAAADRVDHIREDDRNGAGHLQQRPDRSVAHRHNDVRSKRDQLRRIFPTQLGIAFAPAVVDPHIAAVRPAQGCKGLLKNCEARAAFRSGLDEPPDVSHPLGLLRARRERPRSSSAAEKRDEVAALHSITLLCPRLAKAVSISPLVLAVRTSICRPMDIAAVRTSVIVVSEIMELFGLTSTAKRAAPGSSSCKRPSCLAASSRFMEVTPVTLPPGWLMVATRPVRTGSPPIWKTIGIAAVAALAASAGGVSAGVAMTATRR